MTREEIMALFTRREAAWRAHDAAALAADHATDGVVISPTGGVLEGRGDIERIYRIWFTAFPDLAFATTDLLIDGDRVAQFDLPGDREAIRGRSAASALHLVRRLLTRNRHEAD